MCKINYKIEMNVDYDVVNHDTMIITGILFYFIFLIF